MVYRNPKSKFIDLMPLFLNILNTTDYCFFIGDFNSELLQPKTRLRIKHGPVKINECKSNPPSNIPHRNKEAL